MAEDILYVKMLDDNFVVYLNDDTSINEIFLTPMLRNRSIKLLQLLAYLLYYHGTKVDRQKLLTMLYGDDYDDMADNNLRAVVFRLRKILGKIGISSKDVILNHKGVYSWNEAAVTLAAMPKTGERDFAGAKAGLLLGGLFLAADEFLRRRKAKNVVK